MRQQAPRPMPEAIEGVLFDFHSTLVDQGDARRWLELAWSHAGRDGDPVEQLGPAIAAELVGWVDRIWEHAGEIDPGNRRDLDPTAHREVFDALVARLPAVDAELRAALYETLLDTFVAYQDTAPVLRGLNDRAVRTVLISNVGIDIRPVLHRSGLTGLLDAVVLSFEAGAVKPSTTIFQRALDLIGVPATRALMVGDSWRDDAAAAALGIRTLILPRTSGATHGLDLVLRIVAERYA